MESKVNYAAVGFFVIFFGILGIGVVVWIIGGNSTSRSYKEYIVCTNSTVNGLHPDSPVKYKGLSVGKVVNVEISKENPDYLLIHVLIRNDLQVDRHIVAQISSNGLTGISYINLINKDKPYSCPKGLKLKHNCIPAIESNIRRIMNKLPEIADKMNAIVSRIDSMFDNETKNNFKELTKNFSDSSKRLKITLNKLDRFLDNANKFTSKATYDAAAISKTISKVDNLIDQIDNKLNKLDQTTFKESYETAKKIKSTITELKQLIREIRKNPDLIIKGRTEEKR